MFTGREPVSSVIVLKSRIVEQVIFYIGGYESDS